MFDPLQALKQEHKHQEIIHQNEYCTFKVSCAALSWSVVIHYLSKDIFCNYDNNIFCLFNIFMTIKNIPALNSHMRHHASRHFIFCVNQIISLDSSFCNIPVVSKLINSCL